MNSLQPIPDSQWQTAFDKLLGASSDRSFIIGRLGVKTSSSSADLAVPTRPGYYYVSTGLNGELGQSQARDGCGVAAVAWQTIWMVRENGELVICRATTYGGGGSGGASNLDALTDVTINAPANGNTLQYNSTTGQWVNVVPAGGAGIPNPHGLSSAYHSGLLNWPLINFSGSDMADLAIRRHVDLQGMTPNDHHNQAHVLATGTALGPDHSISGAAIGEVLRALSATTAAFDQLQHTDLGNVLPDQHHQRTHDIITGDTIGMVTGPVHTVVGADFTVVGVHPANNLAILPTSNNPGAAVSILRTDANGGIQLDTNVLYVDGANNWIGVNRTPSGATLDLIAAANADHTQRIKMKSGQTARLWRIEDLTGNELIVLDSVGDLQSGQPGFVSGLTGWQITPQGNAEFNNIWARGELHATVFVKDEVHATGGTLLVASAGTLHDDAVIDATAVDDDALFIDSAVAGHGVPLQIQSTSASFSGTELRVSFIGNFLNINDPPSGPGFYFQPGDIIRSKTEVPTGVTDFWLEVNNATQYSGYASYSVVKRSGTDGTLPKGSAVVSYGQPGDGRILLTSDLNYAPYLDVFTVGPQVWTGNAGSIIPRVRLGRLDGVGLPGISGVPQYGMVAGSDLSNANSGYFIASDKQFALYKVPIRLNNGTSDTGLWTANGNLRIGSNIAADATTGFRVYTVDGGGYNAGDVVIGNTTTGNFLRWNQVSGTLQVVGSLVVSDPGTTVTLKYVDDQDKSYDLAAQGYGSSAQTNAQNYGDASRITGVTGTWTSTTANVITWSTLTATFINGGARTIAAGSTTTMAVRTYLYVNTALSGTLTLIPTTTPAQGQPSYVLIAVCDPGSPKASVTVVAGTTFISGANIATGSIQAAHIVANSIDAGQLTVAYNNSINTISANAQKGVDDAANAQIYGDNRRIVGVSGTWTVLNGDTISWGTPTAVQVKFANGTARTITANAGLTMTGPARNYLYVDMTGTGTMTMAATTSIAAINSTNHVLIAVVDTYATPATTKASIQIVAGSTYISGGNIVTQSITATNIAAGTIDASLIDSSVYVSAGGYRVAAVSDSFAVSGKVVSWTSLVIIKGDGTNINVTNGSFDTTGRTVGALIYLYIDGGAASPTTLTPQTVLAVIPAGAIIIAVIEAGATFASYRVVNGGTIITGDQIVTNSIVTANLAAGAVTAAKITVDGNIDIATGGAIRGNSKAYASATAGFFLGYSSGYKLDVGDSAHFLRWDGSTLAVQANSLAVSNVNGSNMITLNSSSPSLAATMGLVVNSLQGSGPAITTSTALEVATSVKAQRFSATASIDTPTLTTPDLILNDATVAGPQVSNMIQFTYTGLTHYLGYDKSGVLSYDGTMTAAVSLNAPTLIGTAVSGLGLRIPNSRTPANNGDTGTTGDFCWDNQRLYVRTNTGWHYTQLTALP